MNGLDEAIDWLIHPSSTSLPSILEEKELLVDACGPSPVGADWLMLRARSSDWSDVSVRFRLVAERRASVVVEFLDPITLLKYRVAWSLIDEETRVVLNEVREVFK